MARNSISDWWKPRPMTQEEMEMEIHSTKVVSKNQEFTDEAMKETLKSLNLSNKYDNRNKPAE